MIHTSVTTLNRALIVSSRILVRHLLSTRVYLLFCLFIGVVVFTKEAQAQSNPRFNVDLHINYTAAQQAIDLFEDQFTNTQSLAELRGNRIAASTTGLIANNGSVTSRLQSYLDSLKSHQIIRDDVYNLEEARKNVAAIKELLTAIEKRNFNRRVAATVEQIFPTDANVSLLIPVYIVAFGHENVDAYVRRIIWHGDTPQFTGENDGELTIVINLGHAVRYGDDVEERLLSVLGVVAHEVFHAAFGAYKESSPTWKRYYKNHHRAFDELLDLTQNEGIAYYLSLDQQGRGRVPRDWYARARDIFASFNRNAEELLSDALTHSRATELLRAANLSGYWESYGAMTGMFIAREIDLRMGRQALIETIAGGPIDLFNKYIKLTERDNNLQKISGKVIRSISQR